MRKMTHLREAADLTRAQLGYRAKVHPARVGAIESGRATPLAASVELCRLAKALKWTGDPAALLEEVEQP